MTNEPKTMNAAKAKIVHEDMTAALKSVFEKHGLAIVGNRATYDHATLNFSIKTEIADLPIDKTPYGRSFVQFAELYGLTADMLGREFRYKNKTYKVIGSNSRSKKRPIVCQEVGTDQQYNFTAPSVRAALGAKV